MSRSQTRGRAQFSGSLANLIKAADLKQARLLDRVDAHIDEHDLGDRVELADRVGCQNSATASEQRFQAAASYSLIKPPRIG